MSTAAPPDAPTRSERRTNAARIPTALPDSKATLVGRKPAALRRFLQADLEARQAPPQAARARDVQLGELAEIGASAAAAGSGVTAAAISPGMTLIRNSHGHDQLSVIQPPTIGPTVGASTATTPPIVVATA